MSMVTSCTHVLSRAAPPAKLPHGALQSGKPAAMALQMKPRPLSVRCAAGNAFDIEPFALVNPTREAKKQQAGITGGEGTTRWGIKEDGNTVKLWFVITDIVQNFNVKDAVEVVLHHDDVLVISEKKTTGNALDVRLLMPAGYKVKEKGCRWEKKDDGEVRLEVTIEKRPIPSPVYSAVISVD